MREWKDDGFLFYGCSIAQHHLNTALSLLRTTHSTIPLAASTEIPLLLLLQLQPLHADILASLQ